MKSALKECDSTNVASLAQLVERTAFNRVVVGSIPTGGEKTIPIARNPGLTSSCYWLLEGATKDKIR